VCRIAVARCCAAAFITFVVNNGGYEDCVFRCSIRVEFTFEHGTAFVPSRALYVS
jgi:hypothetical protein